MGAVGWLWLCHPGFGIYRTAVRIAHSAAATMALSVGVSDPHCHEQSQSRAGLPGKLVGDFLQHAPGLLVQNYGSWAGAECWAAPFRSWPVVL